MKKSEINKKEQIIQGLQYAKNILNTITVSGIDNCQKISAVYNNMEVFLNMIINKEIDIINLPIETEE